MSYVLRVQFKSNERPFSTTYEPLACHQAADDEAAIAWALGIRSGLGEDYQVTLVDDGRVIPLPEGEPVS